MSLQQQFEQDGFAVLPSFYDAKQIDDVLDRIQQRLIQRPLNVTIDLLDTGERTALGLLTREEVLNRRMKINDLFLDMPEVRELALSQKIVPTLNEFLGDPATLCNSLYFEKGSAQPPHVDSLYMTPLTQGHLIAIWVALEDAHPDAGQLIYYPGSHKIRQHVFSNGEYHFAPDEMPAWDEYMMTEVRRLGLDQRSFSARKGDVLIWHAHLLHGGGPIADLQRTRRSLVFHYYSERDALAHQYRLASHGKGLWVDRPPQPLPRAVERLRRMELQYLARYPDVAQAVRDGRFDLGRHHFEAFGEAEGRLYMDA